MCDIGNGHPKQTLEFYLKLKTDAHKFYWKMKKTNKYKQFFPPRQNEILGPLKTLSIFKKFPSL